MEVAIVGQGVYRPDVSSAIRSRTPKLPRWPSSRVCEPRHGGHPLSVLVTSNKYEQEATRPQWRLALPNSTAWGHHESTQKGFDLERRSEEAAKRTRDRQRRTVRRREKVNCKNTCARIARPTSQSLLYSCENLSWHAFMGTRERENERDYLTSGGCIFLGLCSTLCSIYSQKNTRD